MHESALRDDGKSVNPEIYSSWKQGIQKVIKGIHQKSMQNREVLSRVLHFYISHLNLDEALEDI